MNKKDFCQKHNITEAQFNGTEEFPGSLDLRSVTAIPEGFNPTVGGYLDLRSVTAIPEGLKLSGNNQMTIAELKSWASIIRAAGLIPVDKTNTIGAEVLEARAIAKIMAGNSWGINPFEAQSLFHFIPTSGTIVPDYKALLMRIKMSGKYDYEIVELTDSICTLRGFRAVNGKFEPMVPDVSFTLEEAKTAGLYSEDRANGKDTYKDGNVKAKGAWEAYTKDKLLARAVNRLFKRNFPDLCSSIVQTKEDFEDAAVHQSQPAETLAIAENSVVNDNDLPFSAEFEITEEVATFGLTSNERIANEKLANTLLEQLTKGNPAEVKKILKGRTIDQMADDQLTDLIDSLSVQITD